MGTAELRCGDGRGEHLSWNIKLRVGHVDTLSGRDPLPRAPGPVGTSPHW